MSVVASPPEEEFTPFVFELKHVPPLSQPNLAFVDAPRLELKPGGVVTVIAEVANWGGASAAASRLEVREDNVVLASVVLASETIPALDSFDTAEVRVDAPLFRPLLNASFVVVLDADDAVAEVNEQDNHDVISGQHATCLADAAAPNQTPDQAAPIPDTGLTLCDGEEDWFSIPANEGDGIYIIATPPLLEELRLFAPGSAGVLVEGDWLQQHSLPTTGTYRLRAGSYGLPASYQLAVHPFVCVTDPAEPDELAPAPLGCAPRVRSACEPDEDWFAIRLPPNTSVPLVVEGVTAVPPTFDLYTHKEVLLSSLGSSPLLKSGPTTVDYLVAMTVISPMASYTARVDGPGPDLTLSNASAPEQAQKGGSIEVSATVTNHCSSATSAVPLEVRLAWTSGPPDMVLGQLEPDLDTLGPGEAADYGGSLSIPTDVPSGSSLHMRLVTEGAHYTLSDDQWSQPLTIVP
ncbi:MAG: hypothetical protein ACI9WU_003569 [Myxococcota bacterium]